MIRAKITQFVFRILFLIDLYILYTIFFADHSLIRPLLEALDYSLPVRLMLAVVDLVILFIATPLCGLAGFCTYYENAELVRRKIISDQLIILPENYVQTTPPKFLDENPNEKSFYQFLALAENNEFVFTKIPVRETAESKTIVRLTKDEPRLVTSKETYRLRKCLALNDSYLTRKTKTITVYTLYLNRHPPVKNFSLPSA